MKIPNKKTIHVLDKTLRGIRGVRLDNRKVLRAPGFWIKYFERYYFLLNKQHIIIVNKDK